MMKVIKADFSDRDFVSRSLPFLEDKVIKVIFEGTTIDHPDLQRIKDIECGFCPGLEPEDLL